MWLLDKILKIEREVTSIPKTWRTGMWVMTQQKQAGILFRVGSPCEVHIVDTTTGETVECIAADVNGLRQCTWAEIPACRRMITQEQGRALGYGS